MREIFKYKIEHSWNKNHKIQWDKAEIHKEGKQDHCKTEGFIRTEQVISQPNLDLSSIQLPLQDRK
jgi:hypothetical protein